ncbi:hypothetical protein ACUXZJ_14375 [Flavobacterium sp. TN-1]
MAKKYITKEPKYKQGDVLKYTNPISKEQDTVILLRRYDTKPQHRIAWWYTSYPNGSAELGAPEEEFSRIDLV